jgi:WD40 repeat protein
LVSGSDDGAVKLWSVEPLKVLAVLQEQGSKVFSVAFSPDGKYFASGSKDKIVKIWHVNSN